MEYTKLELDLSGLKRDVCYVLEGNAQGLVPAMLSAGVPFVSVEDSQVISKSARRCQGEGKTALTNLESLPSKWQFTEEVRTLTIGKVIVPLEKSDMPTAVEERFVYGEVLIPDYTDSQGHTISAELIRQTSHDYMAEFQRIGLQHGNDVTAKVSILESYIAPADFELAGANIKRGTWMMGVRVHDDTLWGKIKAGELTGFSIGGWGRVEAL